MDPRKRRVAEVMHPDFATLQTRDRLDYADQVMRLGRIRHMPVLEGDQLVGVVSHRDLLAASLSKVLEFKYEQRRAFLRSVEVGEVMTRNVVGVDPDATLTDAARLMLQNKIGCLPVVRPDGTAAGFLTETDLLRVAFVGEERPPEEGGAKGGGPEEG